MRERPKVFLVLAVALAAIAVAMPLQIAWMFGYQPWELGQIFSRMAPLNWAVSFLAAFGAALCMRASPWLLVTAPVFILTVFWNNWLVSEVGLNYTWSETLIATAAVIALHAGLLTSPARRVLMNPHLRWWLTSPRKRAKLRVTVWPVMGGELVSSTVDISLTGAFISADDLAWTPLRAQSMRHLKVGSHCSVRFKLDNDRSIHCTAEIVRHSPALGSYPSGFGVRFVGLGPEERQALGEFIRRPTTEAATETVASVA